MKRYKVINPFNDFEILYDPNTETITHTVKSYYVMHTEFESHESGYRRGGICASYLVKTDLSCTCDDYTVNYEENLLEWKKYHYPDNDAMSVAEMKSDAMEYQYINMLICDCYKVDCIDDRLWLIKKGTFKETGIAFQLSESDVIVDCKTTDCKTVSENNNSVQ